MSPTSGSEKVLLLSRPPVLRLERSLCTRPPGLTSTECINVLVVGQALDEYGLAKYFESDRIQVAGLIVAEYNADHSHWNSTSSLGDWLRAAGIPALHGIDTRMLTKQIRESGAMLAKIEFDGQQ